MSKITINKAIKAAEHPILLETSAQLKEAEKSWSRSPVLGLDTEFVRERTYRADLGLVQVSDGETAWLFDPLAIESAEPLVRMFTNPNTIKLLHSCTEDLEVLLNTYGALPEPLVDTQVACAMLGQPLQLGYHHTVKWMFDIEIDKEQTRSNWLKRPLTDRQLHYAAMDAVLLPEMLMTLQPQLEQLGRWSWLQEDIARMQQNARTPVDPEFAYLRFASLGRLDDDTLRALKHLSRWREITASERNRARGFVISDAGMLQLARARPTTAEELRGIEDIHPVALSRYGSVLLESLAEAAADQAPVAIPEQLTERQKAQLKQMRQIVQQQSTALDIEPALLASRKELEKLIRALGTGSPVPERFLGWRKEVVTDQLTSL